MRLFNKNILLALALLAVAQGCEKEPAGPKDTGAPIMLSAAESGTKALLDNGTFNKNGNRLVIYDYVDNSAEPYFVDQIGPDVPGNTYGFEGVWPFANGPHQWTPGVHKFFGWLVNDYNGTENDTSDDLTPVSLFGNTFSLVFDNTNKKYSVAAFDEESRILSIPEITMDQKSPQFDFLYSDIFTTDPRNEPVPLEFKHLFTAFRITAQNNTADNIIIDSISIDGWKNFNSAQIVFNINSQNNEPIKASYGSGEEFSPGKYVNESEDTDPEDKNIPEFKFDFTDGSNVGETISETLKILTDYYLTWPHDSSEGDIKKLTIKIVYKYNNISKTKKLDLPNFNAGYKYDINLKFDIDQITFKIKELVRWGTLKDIDTDGDGVNDTTIDDGKDIIEEV